LGTFFTATMRFAAVSLADTTTPYAPVPIALRSTYLDASVYDVPLREVVVCAYDISAAAPGV
jgi:hypothetical protein